MAVIKCKMCGGELLLEEGSVLAECEYCGSLQTVPNSGNEKMLSLFARANRLRANCEFDKASGLYEAIIADFPEEAEAYWGLVLCKYGIEYVDDPLTRKKIPTCHRSSFQSVLEDDDFEQTLENADVIARKVYREEAKQIEELRKEILSVSSKENDYDIFICYKETDVNGDRTLDSVIAQDIYNQLVEKDYRVFFSRVSLENKLGSEYEPAIFSALNSAKVMLVVGTEYEHFNAVWVRNEWGRYIKQMETDKNKHLIPCYKNIDAYDMPKEFAKLQALDFGKVGAMQDLLRGVEKLISSVMINEKSKNEELAAVLNEGNEALEKGDWTLAKSRFDLALYMDPTCAEAHVGKLMIERKCKTKKALSKAYLPFNKSSEYQQAILCADEALKKELEEYNKKANRLCIKRLIAIIVLMIGVKIAGYFSLGLFENYLYSNPDKYAETAYILFSKLEFIKEPTDYTKLLLRAKIGDVYEEVLSIETVSFPEGVTRIEDSMFYNCKSLKSIEIPDSVTSIGANAFCGCRLENVEIPDSVTTIGEFAFCGCNFKNVEIPEGVTSIEHYAFGETSLESIKLPRSIISLGMDVFGMCNIKEVYYAGTKEEWEMIDKEDFGLNVANIHFESK